MPGVNYKQVTIRRDVLAEAAKVYTAPVDKDGEFEYSDSSHFINFVDDVYNYILEGKKPSNHMKHELTVVKNTPTQWK